MFPHFANPAALWALLALPAIVAIHFLHRRPRERVTATLFLLEALLPEDRGGRAWDRLRSSRALWLQLGAALLLAWSLAEPMWPREGAHATVVFVLDESADMQPFRQEAMRAVENDMRVCAEQGLPITWILMGSRPATQPFYQGQNAREALKSLETCWLPHASTHDLLPALRAASALAGRSGISRLVTCRPERVPPGQCARSVGNPLPNLGFAGVTPQERAEGIDSWRIAVKNNSRAVASPSIAIHAGATSTTTSLPAVEPGGMAEFAFSLPPGCERATLQLPQDPFTTDNALVLVRERPKPVSVRMQLTGAQEAVLRKLVAGLPGFSATKEADPSPADRPAASLPFATDNSATGKGPAVIFAGAKRAESARPDPSQPPVFAATVAPESHPLTEGLNWSGLLVSEPGSMTPGNNATVLLWQASTPLAWLQEDRLFVNWRWQTSNAGRIPAPLLMIRRYLQSVQERAPGTVTGNLPGGSLLPMPVGSRYSLELPGGERREGSYPGRLPEETGLVTVRSPQPDAPPLFCGSVWFADARMGDFSLCGPLETGLPPFGPEMRRQLRGDPFVPLWLALAGLALLASWSPPRPHRP